MTQYMQLAVVAAHEALNDANWRPEDPRDQDVTVRLLSTRITYVSHILIRVSVLVLELVVLKIFTTPLLPLLKMYKTSSSSLYIGSDLYLRELREFHHYSFLGCSST